MAQTKQICISNSFGRTLKQGVDYTDNVKELYATITSNLVIRHSDGHDIKEMLKDLKDDIMNDLNGLKLSMTIHNKETGNFEEKDCIKGSSLVPYLTNDWDLQEVIYFICAFKEVIDDLSNVDGNRFTNQNQYLKSFNGLKTSYEKLQKLCNMFVMFDIMNQLSHQL